MTLGPLFPATPSGAGSGTVTSVGVSGGTTGIGVSGSPVTTSGTITLTVPSATSSASTIVARDANQNAFANNFISKATNVVSAGGTTTLTSASTMIQNLTGATTQTFKLPDATTLSVGYTFVFNNNSSGNLSVVDNGSNAITTILPGSRADIIAIAVSTANGSWDVHFGLPSNTTWGTSGLSINDTLFTLQDNADTTKKAKFELSSITTGTSRTLTVPDADLTIAGIATTQTLTNKTLVDASTSIVDDGDATKVLKFQCSGIATGTTRTITVPDASGTATLLGNSSTGSGSVVLATSPTLVTPTLGVAAATSINFGGSALANFIDWTTYTPTVTLVGGAGNTVPQYTTNIGYYTQIGKLITVMVYLTGDGGNEGAGTGQINIALPVSASSNQPTYYVPCGQYLNNTAFVIAAGQIQASASTIELGRNNAGAFAAVTGADQNNATRSMRLTFQYMV